MPVFLRGRHRPSLQNLDPYPLTVWEAFDAPHGEFTWRVWEAVVLIEKPFSRSPFANSAGPSTMRTGLIA